MRQNAPADAPQVFVGVAASQDLGRLHRQPGGHVPVERIMRARLIGHDVNHRVARHERRQHVRCVPGKTDRERPPLLPRALEASQRVIEVSRALVQIARFDPPLDPAQVNLHTERAAAEHRDGQRLCGSHAAKARGHDQTARERPVEALARHRRERLEGPLQDPLAADVDPRPGGHLPVHRQARDVEL